MVTIKMSAKHTLLLTLVGLLLFSCSTPEPNPAAIATKNDEQKKGSTERSQEANRRKIEIENRLDSVRLDGVLNQALLRIQSKSFTSSFSDSFQILADGAYNVDVKIAYDFHFSNKKRHLTIHRYSPSLMQIDVFAHTESGLTKILRHEQWTMEYVNDTIRDVNGDGLKDLVVNCYGTTGCCLKAFSSVYLSRNEMQSFSAMHHFRNPTFSGRDGVIRGVCYGHPGETELYKFKWNGEKIDTIEYISYEKDDHGIRTGKVIVSNQYPHHKNCKISRKVNTAPKEYRGIVGYDWFTGKL